MLRLVSNNQWRNDFNLPDWIKQNADCSAHVREKGFCKLYGELLPDVIGLQEVSPLMTEELMIYLKQAGNPYSLVYGKDTPILFKNDKLELLDSDFFIYPEEIPNFKGSFNNENSKSWSVAVFKEKATGKVFVFMSTHLWWMSGDPKSPIYQPHSDDARVYQIDLATDKLSELGKKYNCPVFLCGDLNTPYNTAPILKAKEKGFLHAHDIAKGEVDQTQGYHWCGDDGWQPMQNGGFAMAIDHFMVKGLPNGIINFRRYTPEYYMPLSDHSPLYIDIEL